MESKLLPGPRGTVRRAARTLTRRRAFLLTLAVVPQLLSLGALAGIFWAVRVREIVIAPVRVVRIRNERILRCSIRPADAPKLLPGTKAEVEILDNAGEVRATGRGFAVGPPVQGRSSVAVSIVGPDLDEALTAAEAQHLSTARVIVRARRALTVVLESNVGRAPRTTREAKR